MRRGATLATGVPAIRGDDRLARQDHQNLAQKLYQPFQGGLDGGLGCAIHAAKLGHDGSLVKGKSPFNSRIPIRVGGLKPFGAELP